MITRDLVERRIRTFWGYGSLEARVWFVGMEEGLGDTAREELEERFRVTDGKTTVDMRRGMKNVPLHMAWFRPPRPRMQPNWKYPIALHLYLKNRTVPSLEDVRAYQANILGDLTLRDTCVIELMPLPARSTHDSAWLYHDYIGTRQEYLDRYKRERVQQLRTMVTTYRPHLVIFHTLTYLDDWSRVIGTAISPLTYQMYFAAAEGTVCCVIPNANTRGMSYKRLYDYADRLLSRVELNFVS